MGASLGDKIRSSFLTYKFTACTFPLSLPCLSLLSLLFLFHFRSLLFLFPSKDPQGVFSSKSTARKINNLTMSHAMHLITDALFSFSFFHPALPFSSSSARVKSDLEFFPFVTDGPCTVKVNIYLRSISKISDLDMVSNSCK